MEATCLKRARADAGAKKVSAKKFQSETYQRLIGYKKKKERKLANLKVKVSSCYPVVVFCPLILRIFLSFCQKWPNSPFWLISRFLG